jgi:hypothetical protein
MKGEQPPKMTLAQLEREFGSGDGKRIETALWTAFHSRNCVWVESRCLHFLGSAIPAARRGAATVLGNLAALYGDRIDLINAHEALLRLSKDPDKAVRTAVSDSLAEVMHRLRLHKKLQ